MWCRSPQIELVSAFFFKSMKHYFGEFFGQISSLKSLLKWKIFRFKNKIKYYILQIKMSKVVFSSPEFYVTSMSKIQVKKRHLLTF